MITIVLPISRKEYLFGVFKGLDDLIRPAETELLIITDGNRELEDCVQSLLDTIHFNRIQVVNFGNSPASDIYDRRHRIAEIHNFAKHYVSEAAQEVFLLEDDTVLDPEGLMKLIESYEAHEATFMQGVQVGRWKTPYIGGWLADDIKDPQLIKSVAPGEGVQEIDAGGLYCALVDAKVYKQHHFEPYVKYDMKGLSCDVNFGLWMRYLGMKVMMNWDVQCGHYKDGQILTLDRVRPVVIVFDKNYNGKWLATNHWADEEKI